MKHHLYDVENPRRKKPQRMLVLNMKAPVRVTLVKVFLQDDSLPELLTTGGLIAQLIMPGKEEGITNWRKKERIHHKGTTTTLLQCQKKP